MLSQETINPLVSIPLFDTTMTPMARLRQTVQLVRAIHKREQTRVRAEIMRIPGLMTLLMKSRNGAPWSFEDRAELRTQLYGLGRLGLYLVAMAVPGTTLTLPLLAWWLDRRQQHRITVASTAR